MQHVYLQMPQLLTSSLAPTSSPSATNIADCGGMLTLALSTITGRIWLRPLMLHLAYHATRARIAPPPRASARFRHLLTPVSERNHGAWGPLRHATPRLVAQRRHVDGREAQRQRPPRGQPEPRHVQLGHAAVDLWVARDAASRGQPRASLCGVGRICYVMLCYGSRPRGRSCSRRPRPPGVFLRFSITEKGL